MFLAHLQFFKGHSKTAILSILGSNQYKKGLRSLEDTRKSSWHVSKQPFKLNLTKQRKSLNRILKALKNL